MDSEFLCRNYDCTFCFDMVCVKSELCEKRINPTQADRIRFMGDEELALVVDWECVPNEFINQHDDLSMTQIILLWLKQEIE